ncbi:response regulator [Sulfurovum sp. NBC37-1]|uniref:response regulator n=1 Tax=Sulfurovum sp. (strain NBC37-1) TaxID=387093 RepID=UPI0001587A10|nr:response regulator [Sulfurovum sp. NBC37-1]BAF72981.1 conserved hypothetical protein [Sulfurovum sp. NBC37-1]
MNNINILIVEDESIVAMEIESYIKKLEYAVAGICSHADDALEVVSENDVNIVLMDICIKGKRDGVETATLIKEKYPDTEIIFLTAHLDDYNVDRAVELNPTAYLSKPFKREELKAFLKIAVHKIQKDNETNTKQKDRIVLDREFSYDLPRQILYCCDEMILLTKKEQELLKLLIDRKDHVVDFYSIESTIWPQRETNNNTIRTLVRRLRQKLKHKFIQTVPTHGYMLVLNGKHNHGN